MPTGVYIRTEENTNGCFKKGNISWNKGINWIRGPNSEPRSEEWKEKLSLSLMGRKSWLKGISPELHPRWKGGKSTVTDRIRTSDEYIKWRSFVFKRDGWTCQTCGLRGHGRDIEAHHIKSMKNILEEVNHILDINERFSSAMKIPLLFSLDNGITLCKNCHILTFKRRQK